jgi:peptidoglycan/LPS O-acetylase OafA/YrhL
VKRYSHSLDLVRLVVCLSLAFVHLTPSDLLGKQLSWSLSSGIGSTIFFGMSGFLLCQTERYWRESWRNLAIQRVARLYPAHVIGLVLLAPFAFLGVDRWPANEVAGEVLWNLAGLQAIRWESHGAIQMELNGPAWSVTPLLFGGIALPVLRKMGLREWRVSALMGVLLILCGLRIAMTFSAPAIRDMADLMARHASPVPHVVEILCGGICYLVMTKAPRGVLRWLGRDWMLALAAFLVAAPLWMATGAWGEVGGYYFVHGPVFPAVLLFIGAAYCNEGVVEAFSRAKWVKTGGEMSILVFLLHIPVWRVMYRVAQRLGVSEQTIESMPVIGLGMAVVVGVAYYGLGPAEVSRRWLTRQLESWTEPLATAASPGGLSGSSGLAADLMRMSERVGYQTPREQPEATEKQQARAKAAGA